LRLRLPQVRDYWTTSEVLSTPWFQQLCLVTDFLLFLDSYIWWTPQSKKKGGEGFDPLYKVRPIVYHFSAVFSKYYQPSRTLSIDKMMIGKRCRISFFQYMPKNPTRFGRKVWVVAEAKTGWICFIYTGATDNDKKTPLGQKVVLMLMEQYQGKGHCLFIDSFYTSPAF